MNRLVILTLILLLGSCKNINHNPAEKDELVITTIKDKGIALSEFCSGLSYLQLESNQSSLIGNIKKAIFTDERINILDPKTMRVLIFDINGKFITKTNSSGRGPGEYLNISDMDFDPADKTLFLWDNGNQKLMFFDYNGNFLKERSFKLYATNISKLTDNFFAYYTCNNPNPSFYNSVSYNVIITDSNNVITNNFLPISGLKELRFEDTGIFNKFSNGINFSIPFDNSIYFATDNSCSIKYRINFSNYKIPEKIISDYGKMAKISTSAAHTAFMKILDEINSTSYALGIHNIFENDKLLIFQFNLTLEGTYTVLYNKKSKNILTGIPVNDLDGGLFGMPLALIQDTLFTYISPFELEKKLSENRIAGVDTANNIFHKNLNLLTEKLSGIENPIIVKYLMKDL